MYFFQPNNDDIFVGDKTGLDAAALQFQQKRIKENSLKGVTLIVALNRLLLLVQYIRGMYESRLIVLGLSLRRSSASSPSVALYRYTSPIKEVSQNPTFWYIPVGAFFSTGAFVACWVIQAQVKANRYTVIAQFSLWGVALLIDIVAHAFTRSESKAILVGHGSLSKRLATLTIIILGEGLNGLCQKLSQVIQGISLGAGSVTNVSSRQQFFRMVLADVALRMSDVFFGLYPILNLAHLL